MRTCGIVGCGTCSSSAVDGRLAVDFLGLAAVFRDIVPLLRAVVWRALIPLLRAVVPVLRALMSLLRAAVPLLRAWVGRVALLAGRLRAEPVARFVAVPAVRVRAEVRLAGVRVLPRVVRFVERLVVSAITVSPLEV